MIQQIGSAKPDEYPSMIHEVISLTPKKKGSPRKNPDKTPIEKPFPKRLTPSTKCGKRILDKIHESIESIGNDSAPDVTIDALLEMWSCDVEVMIANLDGIIKDHKSVIPKKIEELITESMTSLKKLKEALKND